MKKLEAVLLALILAVGLSFSKPARAFELTQNWQNNIFGGVIFGGIAGGITLLKGENAEAWAALSGCGLWTGKELMDWQMGRETSLQEGIANCVGGAYWGWGIQSIDGNSEMLWAIPAGVVSGYADEKWEELQMSSEKPAAKK